MADNVVLSAGTADGITLATDDVAGVHYQRVKVTWGVDDTATPVTAANPLPVVQTGTLNIGTVSTVTTVAAVTAISNALPAGTNNIGDVDVLTVPADPFGANADAASATGSISAKLRFIAATGIPITGNPAMNLAQVAGTTADTNSGVKSAGTLRVVLATDQPALTNKLLVTPDSVALPANQSVNVNQLAGTTTDTNSGVKSAGTLRVVLATDQPQLTNKLLVTPDANSAVNVAQINGVAATMGNGVSGTGVLRVTMASDSTGQIAVLGSAAQDAAIAGNPVPAGYRASTATPSAMSADGDVVYPWATRTGATVIDGSIVDDSPFTPATSRVVPIGLQADETATDLVDEGDAGTPRMTLDRKAIVSTQPHTQGGCLTATGSITATATSVKASAGQVYGWYFYNPNASVAYVQFFDLATGSVTLGTTAPKYSLGIPPNSAANVSMSFGIAHATAITIAVTTTRAGSTSPGSSVDYNVFHF